MQTQVLSPDNLKRLELLRRRYPTSQALVLPVLWMAQQEHGWISPETMAGVAQLLDLHPGHVYGVVTFYTMFNTAPVGRHHMQVCTNVSCQLRGARAIMDHACRRIGVKPGERSPDGKWTVTEVECLGSCGTAPAAQINDDYHENLTIEKLDAILDAAR
jgi:NADH-quinone oxidoreductase subunit E